MSTTLTYQSSSPTIETKRPTVRQASPWMLTPGDYYAWLEAQGDRYRTGPILVDAASTVTHRWDEPFVAGRNMCVPPAVDGGYDAPSPNALIRDRWHDLVISAAATKSFTSGSPTQTIAVATLDRAIPAGFVLSFPNGQLEVTNDTPRDATSISLTRIFADVTVTNGDDATASNGFFYQQGTGSPRVANLALVGDPEPVIADSNWTGRKYSCDGIAVSGMGAFFDNLLIDNFPGHGLWVSSPTVYPTRTNMVMPWDRPECTLGHVSVASCYAGISLMATDAKFGRLLAAGCRDYGVRIAGGAVQGGTIHAYGCGTGIWLPQGGFFQHLEGENCKYGIIIEGEGQYGGVRAFSNMYNGLRVLGGSVQLGSLMIEHEGPSTDGSDTLGLTGYAVGFGSWADNFSCPAFRVRVKNGANGLRLGHYGPKTLESIYIRGRMDVGAGTCAKGLHVPFSMAGSNIDLVLGGFTNDLYFDNSVTLTGNTLTFRGASSGTIRWADGTTGTFGTPNVPSAVSSANTVTFKTY